MGKTSHGAPIPPSPGTESAMHPPPTPPPDAEGFRDRHGAPDRDRPHDRFPLEQGPEFEPEC